MRVQGKFDLFPVFITFALALVGWNVVNGLRTDRIFLRTGFVKREREPFLFWTTVVSHSLFCLVGLAVLIGFASGAIA